MPPLGCGEGNRQVRDAVLAGDLNVIDAGSELNIEMELANMRCATAAEIWSRMDQPRAAFGGS